MSEPDIVDVVRRVVASRVGDRHLVEDLTQETMLRVTAAEPRLSIGSRQAYAIVTARHLVADQARHAALHQRHAHRIVEHTSLDGPERAVLDHEETDALAAALRRLDDDERDLLLRHEVDGVSTADLAAERPGTSAGAIAMRLARARATLRLEFLLAYRHRTLPTARCRPVLLALSTGDVRRQRALGAAEHLVRCASCADLARPLSERRRGLAGWLLLPIGAGRDAVRRLRHSRPAQAAAGVAIAGVALATVLVVAATGDDAGTRRAAPATSDAAAPPPAASAPSRPPATLPVATPPTPSNASAPACPPPVPLDQRAPGELVGCPFAPTALTATAVVADEAFWAVTTTGAPVWVQLTGAGESPITIAEGTTVVVAGTVVPVPPDVTDPAVVAAGYVLDVPYDRIAAG